MTEPTDFELLELATPYALHAVTEAERADIDRQVGAAATPVAAAFSNEVRAVRETMAVVSAATAAEPPAHLRTAMLAAVASGYKTPVTLAHSHFGIRGGDRHRAAAAFGVGVLTRPHPTQTVAEQVLAAPDMQTVTRPLGQRDSDGDVLARPQCRCAGDEQRPAAVPGTVYQMWLIGANGPTSAGTMGTAAVQPTTTTQCSPTSAALPNAGVHRRARQRIAAANQPDIGRVAPQVGEGWVRLNRLPSIATSTPEHHQRDAGDQRQVQPQVQAASA